jgi:chloramphenicol-sensitive protein RarD
MSRLPAHPEKPAPLPGVIAAIGAFVIWGIVPIFWKQLTAVDALELIAHRIVWSVAFLACVLPFRGGYLRIYLAAREPGELRLNIATGLLVSVNWLVYVWAVLADRIVDASLGYFLNPLVNVLLGRLFLGERLTRLQLAAVGSAAAGVGLLVAAAGTFPWIALTLALSFGSYGLLKKKSALGPVTGLALETSLLAPLAATFLLFEAWRGTGALGIEAPAVQALVVSTGIVTAVPLLLFATGAKRLRLATLGLLQYIGPTIQFLVGLLLYREPFTSAQAAAFVFIWIGLALYSADSFRRARGPKASPQPGS